MTEDDQRHGELRKLLSACDEVLDHYAECDGPAEVAAQLVRQTRRRLEEQLRAAEEAGRNEGQARRATVSTDPHGSR